MHPSTSTVKLPPVIWPRDEYKAEMFARTIVADDEDGAYAAAHRIVAMHDWCHWVDDEQATKQPDGTWCVRLVISVP